VSERGPRSTIIGTAGHVDHGKSSLVRALTGTDPDRLAEEKRRGLTIELGFARLDVGGGAKVGIVDVPGHEDFMRTMLAGASGIDLLLLVVAADEGPMPQTLEHLEVAELLGIGNGVVALSKTDRVQDDWLQLASDAVREELDRFEHAGGWPIVPVSAESGEGIEDLRAALLAAVTALPGRPDDDLFRLPVDRAFSVAGAGTVVTGSVWSGEIRRGATVRVLPAGEPARVRGVQEFGREVETVAAGARCALALSGLPLERVRRGDMIVTNAQWLPVRRFGAHLRILPGGQEILDHADTVRVYHGTSETIGRVLLASGGAIGPGDSDWAVLITREALPVRARDRFVLRSISPTRTIGGGMVTDLDPGRRWRQSTVEWDRVATGDRRVALEASVRLTGGRGLDPGEISLRTGFPPVRGVPAGDTVEVSGRLYAPEVVTRARDAAWEAVRDAHLRSPRQAGVSLESVRAELSDRYAADLADRVLRDLEATGAIVRDGPEVRLFDHSVQLTETEEAARDLLLETLRDAGLAPPDPARLAALPGMDRSLLHDLLRILVREGRVVAVGPERFVEAAAIERLRTGALKVLRTRSPALPAAFASELGLSRRELIPLLEYLDRTGVTERTGTGRVAGPGSPQST
jgi:selenocysteine-specific elongation factor